MGPMVFDTENMPTEAVSFTCMRNIDVRSVVPARKSGVGDQLPAGALVVTHGYLIFQVISPKSRGSNFFV